MKGCRLLREWKTIYFGRFSGLGYVRAWQCIFGLVAGGFAFGDRSRVVILYPQLGHGQKLMATAMTRARKGYLEEEKRRRYGYT